MSCAPRRRPVANRRSSCHQKIRCPPMKRALVLVGIALVLFLAEFIFVNFFTTAFKPNLLILLIIFVDLHWGSRWGIFAAALSGILKDSFAGGFFGMHTFAFILCV